MRLVASPPGQPFEAPESEPEFESSAAFGPGRRYWAMSGRVLISDGRLLLVMPEDNGEPARLVVSASVDEVQVESTPWWSFGTGLYLNIQGDHYTVEPSSFYPAASAGRVRKARNSVREFETALSRAQATPAR